MPLRPTRLTSSTLNTAVGLLRAPGVRRLVRTGFLQLVPLQTLREAPLHGVPIWRPELRRELLDRPGARR